MASSLGSRALRRLPGETAPGTPVRAIAPQRLDELARAMLVGAEPLRFAIGTTREAIEAAWHLRYAHAAGAGWIRPEDYPDEFERDAFDHRAIPILAWDGDRAVGTCRIVPPRSGRLLPVEDEFHLRVPPAGDAVEWGRLVVTEDHRGDRGYTVLMGLFARAWLETRALGFHVVAGAARRAVIRLYRQLGFDVLVLGPARDCWGETRFPIRLGTAPPTRPRSVRRAATR